MLDWLNSNEASQTTSSAQMKKATHIIQGEKALLKKTTSVSISSSNFASDTEFLGASQGVLGVLHYVVIWCKILLIWQESCWAVFWRACSLSIKDLCFWTAALLCTGKVMFHKTKLYKTPDISGFSPGYHCEQM